MFNTPAGIAVVDVAKIGTAGVEPEIIAPAVRGGYFARRTREIYYGDGNGAVTAFNVDTKQIATCSMRAAPSMPTRPCQS